MPKQNLKRGRNWYAIHTYSGYEEAVKKDLLQRIESMNLQDKIFDVIVPTMTEIEMKKGKAKENKKRIFPGYVLVDMTVDDESWYVVRNTPNVTGFIGSGTTPVPITQEEMKRVRRFLGQGDAKYKIDFTIGENVKITDGPFASYEGQIKSIDSDKGKVKVTVSFLGRETPVELNFTQIKKL